MPTSCIGVVFGVAAVAGLIVFFCRAHTCRAVIIIVSSSDQLGSMPERWELACKLELSWRSVVATGGMREARELIEYRLGERLLSQIMASVGGIVGLVRGCYGFVMWR